MTDSTRQTEKEQTESSLHHSTMEMEYIIKKYAYHNIYKLEYDEKLEDNYSVHSVRYNSPPPKMECGMCVMPPLQGSANTHTRHVHLRKMNV
jgi:hypothetical protein